MARAVLDKREQATSALVEAPLIHVAYWYGGPKPTRYLCGAPVRAFTKHSTAVNCPECKRLDVLAAPADQQEGEHRA